MNNSNSTAPIPPSAKIPALIICMALPMLVSAMQAGRFFQSMGEGAEKWVMFATACAIIFSSPILGILIGHSFDTERNGRAFMGVAVCLAIIAFSTTTSTLAILNTTGSTMEKQMSNNPEVRGLQDMIANNNAKIRGLQEQIDGRDPVRWAHKRSEWGDQIQVAQRDNIFMMSQLTGMKEQGHGSPVAQSFKLLEKYGVSRLGIAILASVLLDMIPFTAGIMLGSSVRKSKPEEIYDFEVPAAKKPQRRLHVA